jgi:hypothetical protein
MTPEKEWLPRATRSPMKTLATRVAYETPWLRVRQDNVEWEDGISFDRFDTDADGTMTTGHVARVSTPCVVLPTRRSYSAV